MTVLAPLLSMHIVCECHDVRLVATLTEFVHRDRVGAVDSRNLSSGDRLRKLPAVGPLHNRSRRGGLAPGLMSLGPSQVQIRVPLLRRAIRRVARGYPQEEGPQENKPKAIGPRCILNACQDVQNLTSTQCRPGGFRAEYQGYEQGIGVSPTRNMWFLKIFRLGKVSSLSLSVRIKQLIRIHR